MSSSKKKATPKLPFDSLIDHFKANLYLFETTLTQIEGFVLKYPQFIDLIHSYKFRVKDPEHLRQKLIRKQSDAKAKKLPFNITKEKLFEEVNDLAGFRIIHLFTHQFEQIDKTLRKIFLEEKWNIIEVEAKTWDEETSRYFQSIGINVASKPNLNLYTSVHYIIAPNRKTGITCEIQVRTLADEVWGEVDHQINYPSKSPSVSCQNQIKVLARLTSSCSRLIDSIFNTHKEFVGNGDKINIQSNPKKSASRKTKAAKSSTKSTVKKR
ncbi:hypothetical protein [Pollutibacter soli]|uniref:hypothetical protein n=1 Tax=Pollutibacter soli TaxID=3034157 RepID=UPI003013619C